MREFSRRHPLSVFIYFFTVILFSIFFTHPVCLIISAVSSYACLLTAEGKKSSLSALKFIIPVMISAAVINALFNHKGATILAYFPGGNPLTLESLIYSAAASALIFSVICRFLHFNKVMTNDKIIYIFGKTSPNLSLAVSMTLRLVPRFRNQIRIVSNARRCIGKNSGGGIILKAKNALTVFSAMITWILENSIETADSMKSRGFGQKGRTAFSIYKLRKTDIHIIIITLISGLYIFIGALCGNFRFNYFPLVTEISRDIYSVTLFGAYFILSVLPVISEIVEEIKWKFLR